MLLNSNIVFSRDEVTTHIFDCVVNIRINKNWEEIVSTAEIYIPNRFRKKNEWVIYKFERGDQVIISLGYLYKLGGIFKDSTREIFRGYVASVRNGDIIKLKCEDKMWLLKQRTIEKYTKDNISLKILLDDLLTQIKLDIKYEINVQTENIGSYRISNSNMVEVLLKLRELGLFARFDGEILKIDTPYKITLTETEKKAKTKDFKWGFNIIPEESNLDFRQNTDIDIVVKGISQKEDNTKITLYSFCDETGTIRTQTAEHKGNQITHLTYNKTESELKEIIEQLLPTVNYTGYYGGFKTYGLPYLEPGYFVRLFDDKYPERNNSDDNPQRYVVKAVETEFGTEGFFQNTELGLRA